MDKDSSLDNETPLDKGTHLDVIQYNRAVIALKFQPIKGPSGMYHVKNGIVYEGYTAIPITGFSSSEHASNIFD